jgi:hypothetical protein
VSDDVKNNGILLHTYNWLLHGNGGGSTGGTFTPAADGGLWVNGNAGLRAVVVSPEGNLSLSTYDDYHGFDWGQEETHSVLQANIKAKNARYLAVLYPYAVGAIEPDIKPLDVPDGKAITIAEPESTTLVRVQSASKKGQSWSIGGISGNPEFPAINSDSGLVRVAAGSDGTLKEAFLEDGSSLIINDTAIVSSESKIILALSFGEGIINGHVIAPSGTSLDLFTGGAPLSVEGDTVSGFVSEAEGMTRITFSGQGDFTVYLSGSSILDKLMAEQKLFPGL